MSKPAIHVRMENRTTKFLCDAEVLSVLKTHFRYRPPGYFFSMKYGHGWDGYINLLRHGRVSTGLFLDCKQEVEKAMGAVFKIQDCRIAPEFREAPAHLQRKQRPYQEKTVEQMIVHSNNGGIILNATASGKTFVAGLFFSRLVGHGCFVVDELGLLDQTYKTFRTMLGSKQVGIVGGGVFQPRRITVATCQTLSQSKRLEDFVPWFSKLDVLIIDELHLALNKRSTSIVQSIVPKAVFGLTATLELEKKDIRMQAVALAGPPVFEYPLEQGVREGYLSNGVVCFVHWVAEGLGFSPAQEYPLRIVHSKGRNSCIECIVREGVQRGRKIVVLVERLAHLRLLSRRLRDLEHRVLSGAYSKEARTAAREAMDADKLRLILASRIFSKGIDIRKVDTIIDATGQPSHNSAVQRYGRGTRKAVGKRGLIHIDIFDRTPVGTRKGDANYNHFHLTANSRARALRKLGMKALHVPWPENTANAVHAARTIFEEAEKVLSE